MSERNNESRPLNNQLWGGMGMQATSSSRPTVNPNMHQGSRSRGMVSCGACKHLKRKCVKECIFAPYFDPEQGGALFAAIHKVFGARNVTKLLETLPPHQRNQAVRSLSYEARARLHDPVGGCASVVFNLLEQVASLQMELEGVKKELITERLRAVNTLQGAPQQSEPMANLVAPRGHHLNNFQPTHPDGPFAPNNSLVNMNMFDPSLSHLASQNPNAVYAEQIVNPPPVTEPFYNVDEYLNDVEDVEETGDTFAFPNQMFNLDEFSKFNNN